MGVAAIAGTSATGVTAGGEDTGEVDGAGAGVLTGVFAGVAAAGVGAAGGCTGGAEGEILGVAADGGDDTGDLGAGEVGGCECVEMGDDAGEWVPCPVPDSSTDITKNAMRSSLDIFVCGEEGSGNGIFRRPGDEKANKGDADDSKWNIPVAGN